MTTKKLKSRQDVLDVRVERGALYNFWQISKCSIGEFTITLRDAEGDYLTEVSVNDILYYVGSNFFEVMFGELQTDKCIYDGITKKEEMPFVSVGEYHKMRCVTSPDPLQYLLDNLKDHNSF